uniref:Sm domain-containing protein n=1 Tax=Strongyloides stercoralis TaxID=6248 RepID=A0AAF5D0T8_STRER
MSEKLTPEEGQLILNFFMNKKITIKICDGRRVKGYLYCTDNYPNILISQATECWEGVKDTERRIGLVMIKRDIIEKIFIAKYDMVKNLSYLGRLNYCTDKDFINKNTVSNPSPNYYEQFVEEYYEVEEDIENDEVIPLHLQKKEVKLLSEKKLIDEIKEEEIIEILKNERALDIECIKIEKVYEDELKANDIAIICSPYNKRHTEALTNVVRSYIKRNYRFEKNDYPTMVKNCHGWFTCDMRKIILHIMTKETREKYKLENLYRNIDEDVEEEYFFEKPDDNITKKEDKENNIIEDEEKEVIYIDEENEETINIKKDNITFFNTIMVDLKQFIRHCKRRDDKETDAAKTTTYQNEMKKYQQLADSYTTIIADSQNKIEQLKEQKKRLFEQKDELRKQLSQLNIERNNLEKMKKEIDKSEEDLNKMIQSQQAAAATIGTIGR